MPLFFIRTTMHKAGLLQRRKGSSCHQLGARAVAQVNRARCKATFVSHRLLATGPFVFRRGLLGPGRSPIWASSSGSLSTAAVRLGTPEKIVGACAGSRTRQFSKIRLDRGAIAFERDSCNR